LFKHLAVFCFFDLYQQYQLRVPLEAVFFNSSRFTLAYPVFTAAAFCSVWVINITTL